MDGMTQHQTGGFSAGRIALIVAVVAAGFSIVHAVRNGRDASAPATASAVAPSAYNPVAVLEKRAADNPGDGSAWAELGAGYFDSGRYADAVTAYGKATAANPSAAALWSALGEARVMASEHDPMPAQAAADFARALSLDARDPRARYFLGVRKDLAGDHQGAIAAWLALLADTPPGAPWESDLRRTIEQVAKINRIDVTARLAAVRQPEPRLPLAARGIPGPSAQDLRAASAIPPGEQRQMAEAMVARLETKLRDNPENIDGWIMLMRSRMTLGQTDRAAQALMDAIAGNPDQADMLRQQAGMLGVK